MKFTNHALHVLPLEVLIGQLAHPREEEMRMRSRHRSSSGSGGSARISQPRNHLRCLSRVPIRPSQFAQPKTHFWYLIWSFLPKYLFYNHGVREPRLFHTQEVAGSSPAAPTIKISSFGLRNGPRPANAVHVHRSGERIPELHRVDGLSCTVRPSFRHAITSIRNRGFAAGEQVTLNTPYFSAAGSAREGV
jgi:hypothetical protein